MSKEKTLLVIAPDSNVMRDCVFNILVAETGEHLASHFCSHSGFAYNDLYGTRTKRKEEWANRFGELEVKFIDETDITEDELVKRNKAWYAEVEKNKTTTKAD